MPRYWKSFVSFGLFAALTTVSQGTAYLLTLSSYVEAVKQVEILFALGHRRRWSSARSRRCATSPPAPS